METTAGRVVVRRVTLLALLIFAAVVAGPVCRASAQPKSTAAPDVSFTVGGRSVFTSGWTKWNTGAQSGGPTNLSELAVRGVDAVVPEINAEVVWKRLVLLGAFGGGFIRDGVLNDDDFASTDLLDRNSHTRSSVGGDALFYGSIDLGVRALRWGTGALPGYLDVFPGLQYWQENYEAFRSTRTIGISPTINARRAEFTLNSLQGGRRS